MPLGKKASQNVILRSMSKDLDTIKMSLTQIALVLVDIRDLFKQGVESCENELKGGTF